MDSLVSVASHERMQMFAGVTTGFLWGSLHTLIHESGHVLAASMVGFQMKQVAIIEPCLESHYKVVSGERGMRLIEARGAGSC